MPDPIIKTGTHLCDGTPQLVPVGFIPEIIFVKLGVGNTPWGWWTETSWCQRTQRVGSTESIYQGIHGIDPTGMFMLGVDPQFNVAGQTLYWVAMADNGSGLMRTTGWIGNDLSSLTVKSGGTTAPAATIIKRDNNLAPAIRMSGMTTTVLMDGGGGTADGINSINNDGTLSLGALPNVNQISGAAIGEGHDCISFWQRPGLIEVVNWVGNGAASRTIPTSIVDPCAAIVIASSANNIKAALKLDVMPPTQVALADAGTLDNAITGLLQTGSVTTYNLGSTNYTAVVFGRSLATQEIDRPPPSQTAKAIVLRGASTSNIDCGTDNSLSRTGAYSLEWWGSLRALTANSGSTYATLIARSNGNEGRADSDGLANNLGTRLDGTWSWGILAARPNDLGDWAGPTFVIVTTNYNNIFDFSGSENNVKTKPWRTGIIVPKGLFHVFVKTDGAGRWQLRLNNKLVKQRHIDMTTIVLNDDAGARVNAGAGVGHRTVIGARQGSSTIGQLARLGFVGASVYGTELTDAQCDQMYRRNFLGESLTDITPVERWLAENATGTSVPASINPANNGTITSGGVVLRDAWTENWLPTELE